MATWLSVLTAALASRHGSEVVRLQVPEGSSLAGLGLQEFMFELLPKVLVSKGAENEQMLSTETMGVHYHVKLQPSSKA